jgi:signal transduction histidine kinase
MDKIFNSEQLKVRIWVDAIHRKADLLTYNTKLFREISANEKNNAAQMAKAFHKLLNANPNEDISFYLDFVTENKTIPLVLVNENQQITDFKNVDTVDKIMLQKTTNLEATLKHLHYNQIPINYYSNRYVYLYYKESLIYTRLWAYFDDLIKNFFDEIVNNSPSLPVLVTDSNKKTVLISGNIDKDAFNTPEKLSAVLASMSNENSPVKIHISNSEGYVFYKESNTLKFIRLFPVIQLFTGFVFVLFVFLLFRYANRSEQNQIWVGMSKETAHQLGTPLSSLMAWTEILRSENVANEIVTEIEKDISRLEKVTQRFSKIGATPKLEPDNIKQIVLDFVEYFKTRTSSKIEFKLIFPDEDIIARVNKYLFEWVLENLLKNAVDAMEGIGTLEVIIKNDPKKKYIFIDVNDTGKGIEPKIQKSIFMPGVTTKKRGWGLGLTLARRIIKNYHKGKLELKYSHLGKGSSFRISLRKNSLFKISK